MEFNDILLVSAAKARCPASYPYVYNYGKHCCKTNKEKFNVDEGERCDGSELQRESGCCEGDKLEECPSGICQNYFNLGNPTLRDINCAITTSVHLTSKLENPDINVRAINGILFEACHVK